MSQEDLDRAVADRTGESIATIRRRGFSIVTPLSFYDPDGDDLAQPNIVDWDQLDAQRSRAA
jgi:DNA-binding winged helix-turn-helix (wHTH) protein